MKENNPVRYEQFLKDKETFVSMFQDKVNEHFKIYYPSLFKSAEYMHNERVKVKEGKKYIKIDQGNSGKFMLDTENNHLYFIKGYGVIDRKKDFGNIADIVQADFDYDGYSIVPKGSNKRSAYGFAGKIA